ncbi:sensor histidine kinase [Amycolatopsis sp. NPDC059657]|uniref:sensor histidine kinase n=1 Tax=Amycolatopsis sp. NPDC059657 TaxID=3346899 RepID=UPI00366D01B5
MLRVPELPVERLVRSAPPLAFLTFLAIGVLGTPGTGAAITLLAAGLAALPLHVRHVRADPPPHAYWSLAAQTVLTFLPPVLGAHSAQLAGFLAAAFLLLLDEPWGGLGFSAAIAAQAVLIHWVTGEPVPVLLETIAVGAGSYAIARTPAIFAMSRAARAELARLEVTGERLRISRDVHDLLGRGLTTVALKGDFAALLLDKGDKRAAAEVSELAEAARVAEEDAHRVARGTQPRSLSAEVESGQSLLVAAGRDCRTDIHLPEDLDPALENVLAWAVREGVTNILRHGAEGRCTVSLTHDGNWHRLEMTNHTGSAARDGAGSGLVGLTERAKAVHGTCEVHLADDGLFTLIVRLPS